MDRVRLEAGSAGAEQVILTEGSGMVLFCSSMAAQNIGGRGWHAQACGAPKTLCVLCECVCVPALHIPVLNAEACTLAWFCYCLSI